MSEKQDKLAKRTVQLIGFGSAALLFIIKMGLAIMTHEATDQIPWYVIMGAFGVGVSADFDITKVFGGKK